MSDPNSTLLIGAVAVFLTQGGLMAVDEFYFHMRRGLKPWESWGHPVDTFFFLACFLFSWLFPPHEIFIKIWIVLAFMSSLIITKDEWIHKKECSAAEQWLHALLFIVHPLSLWVCYRLWQSDLSEHKQILLIQTVLISGFLFYQLAYWQILARKLPNLKCRYRHHFKRNNLR